MPDHHAGRWKILTIWLGLLAANSLVFYVGFGRWYPYWYLKNGALISVVLGFVSVGSSFEGEKDYLAKDPVRYFGVRMQMTGIAMDYFGMIARTRNRSATDAADVVLALPAVLILFPVYFFYLLVILPLQYFPDLLFGAVSRLSQNLNRDLIFQIDKGQVAIQEIPADAERPKGWNSMRQAVSPVAIVRLISAAGFFLINNYIIR